MLQDKAEADDELRRFEERLRKEAKVGLRLKQLKIALGKYDRSHPPKASIVHSNMNISGGKGPY